MEADVKMIRNADGCSTCVAVPPVDIYEEDDRFILKADMPGVSRENLDITLDNRELTIAGKVGSEDNADTIRYREFTLRDYRRTFTVHDEINASGISASLENGVLTLTLPKSEKAKPRKIEIVH